MTGDNVRACPPVGKPTEPQFIEMSSARRAFQRAWADWLRTGPSPAEIAIEMRGSAEVLRQLAEIVGTPR